MTGDNTARGRCADTGGPYEGCHWTCQGTCSPAPAADRQTDEERPTTDQRAEDVYCALCGHVDFAHADRRGCARTDCDCSRVNMGSGWIEPTPDPRSAFAAHITDGVRHALLKERLEALAEELGDRQVKAIVKASQFPEGAERYYRELGRAAGFGVAQRLLRTALADQP